MKKFFNWLKGLFGASDVKVDLPQEEISKSDPWPKLNNPYIDQYQIQKCNELYNDALNEAVCIGIQAKLEENIKKVEEIKSAKPKKTRSIYDEWEISQDENNGKTTTH